MRVRKYVHAPVLMVVNLVDQTAPSSVVRSAGKTVVCSAACSVAYLVGLKDTLLAKKKIRKNEKDYMYVCIYVKTIHCATKIGFFLLCMCVGEYKLNTVDRKKKGWVRNRRCEQTCSLGCVLG